MTIVRNTTSEYSNKPQSIISKEEILFFRDLLKKIPVTDNVLEFAVKLASKTRPNTELAHPWSTKYLSWGAGPRASQYLIVAAKTHAAFSGRYVPEIEDVRAVAKPVLRHRIVRNYMAEAEGLTTDAIIEKLINS